MFILTSACLGTIFYVTPGNNITPSEITANHIVQEGRASQAVPEQEQQLQQNESQLHQVEVQEQQVKQELEQRQQHSSAPTDATLGSQRSGASDSIRPRRQQQQQQGSVMAQSQQQDQQESQPQQPSQQQTEEKPPNHNAMKVVLVGAECAPWSKTGDCQLQSTDLHRLHM